ncbi:MAG: hypothetical protein ACFC03_03125 [Candidatus Malihini olakiniferum]
MLTHQRQTRDRRGNDEEKSYELAQGSKTYSRIVLIYALIMFNRAEPIRKH